MRDFERSKWNCLSIVYNSADVKRDVCVRMGFIVQRGDNVFNWFLLGFCNIVDISMQNRFCSNCVLYWCLNF